MVENNIRQFNWHNRAFRTDDFLVFKCQKGKDPVFIDSFSTERLAENKAKEDPEFFAFDFSERRALWGKTPSKEKQNSKNNKVGINGQKKRVQKKKA